MASKELPEKNHSVPAGASQKDTLIRKQKGEGISKEHLPTCTLPHALRVHLSASPERRLSRLRPVTCVRMPCVYLLLPGVLCRQPHQQKAGWKRCMKLTTGTSISNFHSSLLAPKAPTTKPQPTRGDMSCTCDQCHSPEFLFPKEPGTAFAQLFLRIQTLQTSKPSVASGLESWKASIFPKGQPLLPKALSASIPPHSISLGLLKLRRTQLLGSFSQSSGVIRVGNGVISLEH